MIGFSVTYEGDYINVLRILTMAGIPCAPRAGAPTTPGADGWRVRLLEPEPMAPFMDFVVVARARSWWSS